MPAKTHVGLPVVSDGHQQRVGEPVAFGACTGAIRILLIEDGAVAIEHGARRRLDPPVLTVVPPGWDGAVSAGRGAFIYRIDLDGGPDLAALVGSRPIIAHGAGTAPWRAEIIAQAQRWWRSLRERRLAAITLSALLVRLLEDAGRPGAVRQPLDARFLALVREHLGSGERADALARRLGVSRATLDRRLRTATGTSAADWLRLERLRAAADMLLRWPYPIAEVGRRCGFADGDSFTRAFRRLHGCTPRAWRRRHAG